MSCFACDIRRNNCIERYARMRAAVCGLTRRLIVQQAIELRPNLVFFRAGDMTNGAFLLWLHRCCRRLWLGMVEIEESPTPGSSEALGVRDRHGGAIDPAWEITPSRR